MIRKFITDEKSNQLQITEIENGALIEITIEGDSDAHYYSFIQLELNDIDFLISELKTIEENLRNKQNIYIFISMEEELEIWFDDESLFDVGLDEYLSLLFKEVEELTESNVNNYTEYNYQ